MESNEVVKILFPNGGWLDIPSLFSELINLDSNGFCLNLLVIKENNVIFHYMQIVMHTDESKLRRDAEGR